MTYNHCNMSISQTGYCILSNVQCKQNVNRWMNLVYAMQGLRNVFQLCAKNCAMLGLHAKVRIPTLRSAILSLRNLLVCAEHIYYTNAC